MKRRFLQIFLALAFCAPCIRSQNMSELIRDGKIREAMALLAKIEKDNPSNETILFLHGLLSARGDSAEYYYEAYLKQKPDGRFSDEALFRLAQLKYVQGLYLNAQKRFNRILETHPLTPFRPKCLYWSGMCFSAMGKKDSAAVQFRKLNEEFPENEFKNELPGDWAVFKPAAPTGKVDSLYATGRLETVKPAAVTFSVQIGAFSNRNNALLRKAFFEREGYPVTLKSKQRDKDVFYLVWLGSFPTWEEAKSFGESLRAKFGTSYTLVSE